MKRAAGVLLHPTSLPGHGIGELGAAARHYVDWLAGAEIRWWQVLPLVPVGEGGSPYDGLSAMAGNPMLIDPQDLVDHGLLDAADLRGARYSGDRIRYSLVRSWKEDLLREAYIAFGGGAAPHLHDPFLEYRARNGEWLDDYALFRAVRAERGESCWIDWEESIRSREMAAMARARKALAQEIERYAWEQFVFDWQWAALKGYAHSRGIGIIGDLPIYVALDSVDVWANPELFHLDSAGRPVVVSGVPPDYFSENGQRWGNPLYRWSEMERRNYRWWIQRLRRTLGYVDIARIDHFRGFQAYWEIPASEKTAVGGTWRPGPGAEFFATIKRELRRLPLIAEDLGLITSEVDELRDSLGLPGMRVLQFAFDGDPENPHHPTNHPRNAVAYTGTHDNDTALGWWAKASSDEKSRVRHLIEPGEEVNWAMIRLVFESPANVAVVPLQDILGLGSEARMNTPGTADGNWEWRLQKKMLTLEVQSRIRDLVRSSNRAHHATPTSEAHHPPSEVP